jgi:hypothetical protein
MNSTKSAFLQQHLASFVRIPVALAGLEDEAQGSNQESVPVPYCAGENIIAGRWISPQYNGYATRAPEEARGKK